MAAPLSKKSRFNRPAWSTAPAQPKNDDHEFFRHSSNGYSNIIAEKAKQREERHQLLRKQQEREKQHNSDQRGCKRRRASTNEEDEGRPKEGNERVKAEDADQRGKVPYVKSSASSETQDKLQGLEPQVTASRIDLEEDSKDAESFPLDPEFPKPERNRSLRPKPKAIQKERYSEDESDNDDDYMREIKRKAREKLRQIKLGLDTKPSTTPDDLPDSTQSLSFHTLRSPSAPNDGSMPNYFSQIPTKVTGQTPAPADEDPVIEILIQSSIPDTKPLLVRRRASQPLAEVRLAWCQRQLFDKAMMSRVFFTWRGNRVFDVTTCRNFLSQTEKDNGRDIFETDWESKATESPRIEVIATTQEILEQNRKRQETLKAVAKADEDNLIEADDELANPAPVKEKKLRIILKSPGMPDVNLKVGPNHHIGKIIAAFRQQQGLEGGKSVYLLFDGDRLEEDATVGDTEIEDLDTVDVQIR